ncbi:MAG: glycosyltransferase family 4 protein [Thermoanaerobaculia bacterium]
MESLPLRILLVANTLPPTDLSGVGEQVVQLAGGLREAGDDVVVLGRGAGAAAGPKLLFPLTVLPPFWRALRRWRPHVVQVHESDGALVALLAAVLAPTLEPRPVIAALLQVSYVEERRAVRPLVAGGRVIGRPGARERRFRWLKAPFQVLLGWLTAALADVVLAPSESTARELARDYGLSDVGLLPNVSGGLAIEPAPLPQPPPPDGFWLFLGRLRIRKGVEVLLEALRQLGGDAARPELWIAGDGEHRRALERTTQRLGLDGRVRFLGRCDAAVVGALLAQCRALVVPSTYEGMPLVVLEAMAAAAPVVASAVSGIPEVVQDKVTGWLVPAEDPRALAAALTQAADPAEAQRRGEAGRRRLEERFRPAAAVAAWHQALAPYLSRSETPP